MDNPPALVTRRALERVLARAAELQAATGDAPESEMTEAQLIELGAEVGLSPEHLRQALAEERAGGDRTDEDAFAVAVFGPAEIAAQRVVVGAPAALTSSLDAWMQREEWMRVLRDQPERRVWEPRRDFVAGLRSFFGGRAHQLHVTGQVSGSVVAVDAQRSVIALTADVRRLRIASIGRTAAIAGFGVAATVVLSVLGFMAAVAATPAVGAAGILFLTRNAQSHQVARAQTALEKVLDHMERRGSQPQPPSLLKAIESALPRGL